MMSKKGKGGGGEGGGGHGSEHVPSWIMSFGDMITNMMAFFVMLQSFSHTQDAGMVSVGRGSFRQAVAGIGLPGWLYGGDDKALQGNHKVKYPTDEAPEDDPKNRVIDADGERIRKAFQDLRSEMETTTSDVNQEPLRAEATPVHFAQGRAELDDFAKGQLKRLAFDLQQTIRTDSVRLYVIGLATDVSDPVQQWTLSARRAHAAEECLAQVFAGRPGGKGWGVSSWGAAGGDAWCRKQGFTVGQTSIVVVVVKETVENG
jgi:flagellar motor protein MotB